MTGFAFAHGTVDEMTSPTRIPVKLVALDKPAKPAQTGDGALRSAIVKVAKYYLRMAQSKSPAEMEAMIWGVDSVNGANHGQSCAAFASLTLALGAQSTGQQSWVSGGTTYPWPLHQWADVRVDPNPDSPQITSVMQDAQAHHRWHPLGDGYQPQPGDWVLFDGHVEVVTGYSPGALRTIGGDSAPNLSVNAHTFAGSLAAQGVTGFVNNGQLLSAVSSGNGTSGGSVAGRSADAETAGIVAPGRAEAGGAAVPGTALTAVNGQGATPTKGATRMAGTAAQAAGLVQMPGMMADFGTLTAGTGTGHGAPQARQASQAKHASQAKQASRAKQAPQPRRVPRARAATDTGTAAIPGLEAPSAGTSGRPSSAAAPSYTRHTPSAESTHVPGTAAQQAFISHVAPGA